MGIFIHIRISNAVTKQEWDKVYKETLELIKVFPLAERREELCRGIKTFCLVPTGEREEKYGWKGEKIRRGWFADGDYETMHTSERYSLYRDLVQDEVGDVKAGDALLGVLPAYLDYNWDDSRCKHSFEIWGNKTQGEPYHIYLLAIACLIEARLGEKAFVYGDITRGQCKKAVELANQYLQIPIDIPDRCDMERFRRRISKLSISEKEQVAVFERLYLGTQNADYGEYMRNRYSKEACEEYWRDRFQKTFIGTIGFNKIIKEYLLWGFDLRKLCSLVKFNDEENIPQYEKFVRRILDAKLHVKNKKCDDILKIDQEGSEPYSIYTLMAQFAYAGAENKKVDRYIPIDEIKSTLVDELGDKCDVALIIDEYINIERQRQKIDISEATTEEEFENFCDQDASEVFQKVMDIKRQHMKEEYEKYDITTYEELLYYETGDTIKPGLQSALEKSFIFYNDITKEDLYKELMAQPAKKRCEWLANKNQYILIRDQDWNKIFIDIKENETSFSRYYPMVRMQVDDTDLVYMVIAIVINDDLYSYCNQLLKC